MLVKHDSSMQALQQICHPELSLETRQHWSNIFLLAGNGLRKRVTVLKTADIHQSGTVTSSDAQECA